MTTTLKEQIAANIEFQKVQEGHFKNLMKKLKAAKDYVAVRAVFFELKEIEGDLPEGFKFVFRKDDSEKFWAEYKKRKDKFYPAFKAHQIDVAAEFEGLIRSAGSVEEVEGIRLAVRQNNILTGRDITGPLYELCDSRAAELAA